MFTLALRPHCHDVTTHFHPTVLFFHLRCRPPFSPLVSSFRVPFSGRELCQRKQTKNRLPPFTVRVAYLWLESMVHAYSDEQGELEPRRPQMGHEKCHEKVYDKRPFYRPHNWPLVTERRTQGTLYSRWISGRELARFYDTHLSLVFTSPKNLRTRDESCFSSHQKEIRPFVV